MFRLVRSARPDLPSAAAPPARVEPLAPRERQGLWDLAKRSQRNTWVNPACWLLIAAWTGVWQKEPIFFALNTAIFIAVALCRMHLMRRLPALLDTRPHEAFRIYIGLLLANSVHWGALVVAGIHWSALHGAEVALIMVAVSVAYVGATGQAINRTARLLQPQAVLLPTIAGLLADPTPQHTLLALLGGILVLNLHRLSQVVHDDYWTAVDARLELEERARQLELLSITDALTQVHNRLYFEHRLVAEWSRAAREQQPLSVLIVDLDHFKRINDTHGHPFGDRCLVAAAQALRRGLHRGSDMLARYGGEEFVVLLTGADRAAARIVAERLLREVAAVALEHEGRSVTLACSIGVTSVVPAPKSSPSSAVSEADKALYAAKQQGRNRVVQSPSC